MFKEKKSVNVTGALPKELHEKLVEDGKAFNLALSRLIYQAVEVYLEQGGTKNFYATRGSKGAKE